MNIIKWFKKPKPELEYNTFNECIHAIRNSKLKFTQNEHNLKLVGDNVNARVGNLYKVNWKTGTCKYESTIAEHQIVKGWIPPQHLMYLKVNNGYTIKDLYENWKKEKP
jgi:hypothetical protein